MSLLVASAVPAMVATPAGAMVNPAIVVTTTADVIDGGDGLLSLREAVILANATAGDDTIQLADGATYDLTLCGVDDLETDPAAGDLNVTGSDALTITGGAGFASPPTIDQTCSQRVVANAHGPLTVSYLHLTGGTSYQGGSIDTGGPLTMDHIDESGAVSPVGGSDAAVYSSAAPFSIVDSAVHDNTGSGIFLVGPGTRENTVIRRTSVRDNTASSGWGAAVLAQVSVTIDQSEITGNSGSDYGGVAAADAYVTSSTISGNTGYRAGGIQGNFTLIDSRLENNTSSLAGGGLGTFTLLRTTVFGNHGGFMGGGLLGEGSITDSTVSGNETSASGAGGGIAIDPDDPNPSTPSLLVRNSTITGNTGGLVGGVLVGDTWIDGGIPPLPKQASVVVESSTIAGNTGQVMPTPGVTWPPPVDDFAFVRWPGEPAASIAGSLTVTSSVLGEGGSAQAACAFGPASPVTSGGYNFSADSSCVDAGPGDIADGGDPGLSPLADHGGPTLTRQPAVGSPLIDRVPSDVSTCASSADQRGVARPIGAGCEIGAVEVAGQRFHAVDPVRILDTRPVPQRVGPLGPWTGGATHDVTVVGGLSGVPSTATAVVLNVTATGGTANGDYLSVWPAGGSRPTVSSVNVDAGTTVSNQVTVVLGTGVDAGRISIFNAGGTQQLIVDVNGYYDDTVDGDGFHPLDPVRVIDSRPAPLRVGPSSTWASGQTQDVTIGGLVGVPADADAVVLNVTATGGTANGDYLSVWPAGEDQPVVSSINVDAGRTVPSAVTVKLGTGLAAGKISIFNAGGTQDVLVDVLGYFEAGSGSSFYPVSPRRLIDSRPPPLRVGPLGPWGEDILQQVVVTEPEPGIPVGAKALVANLTATGGTHDHDYLTVYPNDTTIPSTSTVNADAGQTVANAFTTRLSASPLPFGQLVVWNPAGTIDVIIDISGYYA